MTKKRIILIVFVIIIFLGILIGLGILLTNRLAGKITPVPDALEQDQTKLTKISDFNAQVIKKGRESIDVLIKPSILEKSYEWEVEAIILTIIFDGQIEFFTTQGKAGNFEEIKPGMLIFVYSDNDIREDNIIKAKRIDYEPEVQDKTIIQFIAEIIEIISEEEAIISLVNGDLNNIIRVEDIRLIIPDYAKINVGEKDLVKGDEIRVIAEYNLSDNQTMIALIINKAGEEIEEKIIYDIQAKIKKIISEDKIIIDFVVDGKIKNFYLIITNLTKMSAGSEDLKEGDMIRLVADQDMSEESILNALIIERLE